MSLLNKFKMTLAREGRRHPRPRCTRSPISCKHTVWPARTMTPNDAIHEKHKAGCAPPSHVATVVRALCLTFYNLGADASLAQSNTILVAAGTGMSSR